MLQMINHGISTGALFLLVGMIYERRHTRLIAEYGGLRARSSTGVSSDCCSSRWW
jgi:NADH:ubiquinone oxidoreductase subunit 4 (subunit M)